MPFPTTSVLDTFNRPDENPLASGWLGPLTFTGENQLKVLSNQAAGTTADPSFNSSYWNTTYGPDVEAYAKVPAINIGNRIEIYARIVDVHPIDGTDAYCVSVAGTAWTLRKITNSSSVAIGAIETLTALAANDEFGIEIVGTTLNAWHKPVAGAWTLLFSRTDSTWTTAGFTGLRCFGDIFRIDDFGGGNRVGTSLSDDPPIGFIGRGAGW